jgi:hypothetical protein
MLDLCDSTLCYNYLINRGMSTFISSNFNICNNSERRSQWLRGLRHELSSIAQMLGSWVRIPLKAKMSVCVHCVCVGVVLRVGTGLAMG